MHIKEFFNEKFISTSELYYTYQVYIPILLYNSLFTTTTHSFINYLNSYKNKFYDFNNSKKKYIYVFK